MLSCEDLWAAGPEWRLPASPERICGSGVGHRLLSGIRRILKSGPAEQSGRTFLLEVSRPFCRRLRRDKLRSRWPPSDRSDIEREPETLRPRALPQTNN